MEVVPARRSGGFALFGHDLWAAATLAILSLVVGLAVNFLRPDSLPLLPEAPELTLVRGLGPVTTTRVDSPPRIDLDAAIAAHDAQEVLFVDARDAAFHRLERIQGAQSLPRADFKKAYPAFSEKVAKNQAMVIYCSSADCADSDVVARALILLGYEKMSVYEGGFEEWQAADLPTESGQ